jgi:hypothetical protein
MPLVTAQRRSRPVLPRRAPIVLHNPVMHLLVGVRETLVFCYQPPSVFRLPDNVRTDMDSGDGTGMFDGSITGGTAVIGIEGIVFL